MNFQMFKLVLDEAEETEIKLPTSVGSLKKQGSSRKTSTSALLTMPRPLTDVDCNQLWTILQKMGISDHLTCLLRNLYAGQEATVRMGHGITYCFQIEKGVRQGCILSHCLFNLYAEYIMLNARLHELQAGIKTVRRKSNTFRYADTTTLMAESKEELKSLVMRVKDESEQASLKLNVKKKKTKIMASGPITSWQIEGGKVETDFIFMGSKITADGDYSHEIKRCLLLGRKAMTNLDSILKTIALIMWAFVGKVMSLLFNMLSRFVIAFLPRSKHLLISWL